MSDPIQWHRQFLPYKAPNFKAPLPLTRMHLPDMNPWLAKVYEEEHSYPAFIVMEDGIAPTRISPSGGQFFAIAATPFERTFSLLCGYGGFVPVVDKDYYVVGHVGEAPDGIRVFVPRGRAMGVMSDILEAGKPVFVAGGNPDSARFEVHDEGRLYVYRVLTDPDGRIVTVLSTRSADGLAPPDIDPGLVIGIAQISVALGKGVARYLTTKALADAGKIATSFRQAMTSVEKKLLRRGAASEAASVRVLTEEELSMVWGGGSARPLTDNQLDKAIELLRQGRDVHVESIGQMRQIQGELGQLGVRSESSSTLIPQRPKFTPKGHGPELPDSHIDGPGTYRVDPPHAPGKVPYSAHNEYPHINITLRDGKTLAIIVTGSKSF
jgi:hypothetical protein